MASFISDVRQFKTVAEFASYLRTLPTPSWMLGGKKRGPVGTCIHNTYKPVEKDWRGRATMDGMIKHYAAQGWETGPHLFFACHSPNPEHDGIWTMTPLSRPGTHAGACNVGWFGAEMVGDFHRRQWSTKQRALLLGGLEALHRWAHLPANINGHRDCMPGRTCPGDAAYADLLRFRDDLAVVLAFRVGPTPEAPYPYIVRSPCAVLTDRKPDAPLAAGPDNGMRVLLPGERVNIGDITLGWAWIKTGPGRLDGPGFVPLSYLEKAG